MPICFLKILKFVSGLALNTAVASLRCMCNNANYFTKYMVGMQEDIGISKNSMENHWEETLQTQRRHL